jgi:hypothetical protein
MMENDPRTEEQVDEDWRRVTESIFGVNTRAEPKVAEWKDSAEKSFKPNWGNNTMPASQELRDEEKRWADLWKGRRLVADRKEIDKQRGGGGSPVRNQKPKSTFLDEIDDSHGDYSRAGAAGYDRGPQYPYTMEDVRKYDAEDCWTSILTLNARRQALPLDRNRQAQRHLKKQVMEYTRVSTV